MVGYKMSEYQWFAKLYEMTNGRKPSNAEEIRIRKDLELGERLLFVYEKVCEDFGVETNEQRLYAWELTVAIDEGKFQKAEGLRRLLESTREASKVVPLTQIG